MSWLVSSAETDTERPRSQPTSRLAGKASRKMVSGFRRDQMWSLARARKASLSKKYHKAWFEASAMSNPP